jgi:hypothetical protein
VAEIAGFATEQSNDLIDSALRFFRRRGFMHMGKAPLNTIAHRVLAREDRTQPVDPLKAQHLRCTRHVYGRNFV